MANCRFLRQKKQVKINGEWVDTRSYRYLPYCDGGIPCVIIKGGTPNDAVFIGVNKYDKSSSTEKSLSLDGDGNGYIELESDDCITYINEEKESSSSIAEIRGCYVSKFGRQPLKGYYDMHTMIVSCSTYKKTLSKFQMENYMFLRSYNLIFRGFDVTKETDLSYMFHSCINLNSIDLSNFDTSNVTNMGGMIWGCDSLKSLDVSNFNTSNVTEMGSMFWGCDSLQSLDVSSFNTSNVDNMNEMFKECKSLQSLDVSNFNTSNVRTMDSMFRECESLESLDVSNFNTSNVNWMSVMFWGCKSLKYLDLSNFDTSNVYNMNNMFEYCESLESLDLSNFNVREPYDNSIDNMFWGCSKLKTVYMRGCSQRTISRLKGELDHAHLLDQVTIIT